MSSEIDLVAKTQEHTYKRNRKKEQILLVAKYTFIVKLKILTYLGEIPRNLPVNFMFLQTTTSTSQLVLEESS